ncbi:hypothetical protein C3Y98_09000 [Methylotenera oryzisoli]|uniref:Uncharacterized protein n=2 Tax=Methylotenera oryzisoli TaxID=2080758 RepID=A0A4Y9VQ66_9PROT|nr:hypothetical protein C3Y98_09000 [Methylotenera oryzisoli]
MHKAGIKYNAMKPMFGRLWRVAINAHKTDALHTTNLLQLQFWMVTLMAAMLLIVCSTAHSADSHDSVAHDVNNHDSKLEASEKVYPSRAVQGLVEPLAAGATLHKMALSHHELEAWSFVPKRKDRIEIENRSNITHALYVTYPDGTVVNLEIQIPGDVVSWTVPDDAEGEYVFRCWIHPVIRANMTISE